MSLNPPETQTANRTRRNIYLLLHGNLELEAWWSKGGGWTVM